MKVKNYFFKQLFGVFIIIFSHNIFAIEFECKYLDLNKKVVQVDLKIDENSEAQVVEYKNDGQRMRTDCFGKDSNICQSTDDWKQMTKVKEDNSILRYKIETGGYLVAVKTYDLNKITGRLDLTFWKRITTKSKSNEKFQFRQEPIETKLESWAVFEFDCK